MVDPKTTLEEVSRLQTENSLLRRTLEELETLVETVSRPGQGQSIASSLSLDAQQLLVAAKNGGGRILYVRYLSGSAMQAANRNFIGLN